jgi:peptidoglycan/LPS O-acetylase OafA/YrhL
MANSSFNGPIWSVSIEELVYLVFLLYLRKGGAVPFMIAGFIIERLTHSPIALCLALFFGGVLMAKTERDLFYPGIAGLVLTALVAVVIPKDSVFIYLGAPALLAFAIGLDRRFSVAPRVALVRSIDLFDLPASHAGI